MSALAPELIEPGSILDMSQSDLESLISTIRERRNRVITSRSLAHHRARNTKSVDLGAKLTKLAARLDKAISDLNTRLDKAERLVREVTALRLELGDATPSELAEELRGTRNDSHGGESDEGEGDEGFDNKHGQSDDNVSGSQEQCDDDTVSGSQERPHQGVT
jgi:seryl-tRNA synthetase